MSIFGKKEMFGFKEIFGMKESFREGKIKLLSEGLFEFVGNWKDEKKDRFFGKKYIYINKEQLPHPTMEGEFVLKFLDLCPDGYCIEYNGLSGKKVFEGWYENGIRKYSKGLSIFYKSEFTIKIDGDNSKWYNSKGDLVYNGGYVIKDLNDISKNDEGIEYLKGNPIFGIWNDGKKNGYFVDKNENFIGFYYEDKLIIDKNESKDLSLIKIIDIALKKIKDILRKN